METRPHALAEAAVRALVPPASREHVLGDLQERFTSTRQYVFDALEQEWGANAWTGKWKPARPR